jgi:hypothetical protein
MLLARRRPRSLPFLCLLAALSSTAQQPDLSSFVTTGQVIVRGEKHDYQVRHLPPSSFPDLPDAIADALAQRGCLIPQTYQAHHPENVIHGSFQSANSDDWAVLCTAHGAVSLLVFFASAPAKPAALATAPETQCLDVHDSTGVLGFSWGIDTASPQLVHDAQIGLSPRPPRLDHDVIADSIIDRKTIYRYFANGSWTLVDMPQ